MLTVFGNFGLLGFDAGVKAEDSETHIFCKKIKFPTEALIEELKLPVRLESLFEFGDDTIFLAVFGAFGTSTVWGRL